MLTMLLAIALVALGISGAPTTALAADGSQFRAGNIISDATFYNSAALNADQTQAFIAGEEQGCTAANGQPCLKDYRNATPTVGATSYCSAYAGQSSESAAQIIQRVGQACGINPQVMIVLLEKEQGLVSSSAPTSRMYRSATGYGCPDTADCDADYYGFFNQVYNAASAFQRYTKTSSTRQYQPGRWNAILWHPNTACGSGQVWIENQATANLYIYTPYQPNAAAMANLYGTGDGCSSYGNRNFWRIFTDWFGSPNGDGLLSPSFEGGSVSGWGASNGFVNQAVFNDPNLAKDGSWFLAMNTPMSGRAMTQDVRRTTAVGEAATASVWLRSESAAPFSGELALWGLGGVTELATTKFTVGPRWTEVRVTLPVWESTHSVIRLDVYMATTTGTVWMDDADVSFGIAPAPQNLLKHPSFEGSFDRWAPGNGFMNQQIYHDAGMSHHGEWFAASNTPVAGRSFAQTVSAAPKPGDRYTFSIWLRSAEAGKTFPGQVALWGLGGPTPIVAVSDYDVGTGWTEVRTTLDIPAAGITTLKAEVYLGSSSNTLWLDQAKLSSNLLQSGSFENGSFGGWAVGNGSINQAVYQSAGANSALHGTWFAATNTGASGSSLAQTVSRPTSVGERYTAEVWVRSADPSRSYTGTLALWALGGTTEVASQPFTANGTWQRVRIDLPITAGGQSELKLEVYLGSVDNTLFLDAAQLY
jgi:hypothetical protein